jgi:hypothetical protein
MRGGSTSIHSLGTLGRRKKGRGIEGGHQGAGKEKKTASMSRSWSTRAASMRWKWFLPVVLQHHPDTVYGKREGMGY